MNNLEYTTVRIGGMNYFLAKCDSGYLCWDGKWRTVGHCPQCGIESIIMTPYKEKLVAKVEALRPKVFLDDLIRGDCFVFKNEKHPVKHMMLGQIFMGGELYHIYENTDNGNIYWQTMDSQLEVRRDDNIPF